MAAPDAPDDGPSMPDLPEQASDVAQDVVAGVFDALAAGLDVATNVLDALAGVLP